MNEKPEALRLADAMWAGRLDYGIAGEIAAELRSQHAEIERLREEVRNWKKSFVGHVYVKNEDYAELISKRDALKTENERLRELVRHILGDRITPEAYLLFGKAWVDEAHAALRREET